jgi:hypothetical protein
MSEKNDIFKIEGPFGADRRETALVKRSSGIVDKLINFMIDNGTAEVREGISRQYTLSLNADYPVIALHRYYGLDALERELKEFYAVVDGDPSGSGMTINKWNGSSWDEMKLPPEITLTSPEDTTVSATPGNFEQFKDRTYYTNQREKVLMIKKGEDQIYEAGVPEADHELEISYVETLTGWNFYTDGDENKIRAFLDPGFERHTEGDFGLTLEQSDIGKTLSAVQTLPSPMNLEMFYQNVASSTVTTPDTDGVKLTDSSRTGTLAFDSSYIGLQVKNIDDGSTAVILELVDGDSTSVITTPLKGGDNDDYGNGDEYTIGTLSTEFDYLAMDLFRFAKPPIEEFIFECSEFAPTSDGHFVRGHYVVIYADTGFEHFQLRQRTMLAQWAMDPYGNRLFLGRFRKKWFIPLELQGVCTATSTPNTDMRTTNGSYTRTRPRFTTDLIGSTILNVTTDVEGTITGLYAGQEDYRLETDIAWSNNDSFIIYPSTNDDFANIKYIKFHLKHDADTESEEAARVTVDNIRLLKTPPIPSQLQIQVATCDAQEMWTSDLGLGLIPNNVPFSTEGVSCKQLGLGVTGTYEWTGTRDFSQYGEGTAVQGSDVITFDVGGELEIKGNVATVMTFTDNLGNAVYGAFTVFGDLANMQQRHIHIQDFYPILGENFDWSSVSKMSVTNAAGADFPGAFNTLYIDNIRITPSSAAKTINKFMPLDLIIGDALNKGVEHFFGQNSVIDVITDLLFYAYVKFTRKWVGQGQVTYPDYTHGRYKVGPQDDYHKTLPCLGMQVYAGGELTITISQDDDLTEYDALNLNLDGFSLARPYNNEGDFLGLDWVEIPATPEDEFSIWFSTMKMKTISKITIRLYANANATYEADTTRAHNGLSNVNYVEWNSATSEIAGIVGKRIRNDDWAPGHDGARWGVIGGVSYKSGVNRAMTWGMSWNNGDKFTIDKLGGLTGFNFQRPGFGGKPEIDKDNYYEHVIDVMQMNASLAGLSKQLGKAINEGSITGQEEVIAKTRDLYHEQGLTIAFTEQGLKRKEHRGFMDKVAEVAGPVGGALGIGSGIVTGGIGFGIGKGIESAIDDDDDDVRRHKGWTAGIFSWKRKDMIPHLQDDSPWASMQSIAAHEIIVRAAGGEDDCFITFQDFKMTKKGAVEGANLMYKVKMEDDQGFLGPASEASKAVTATGNDIALSNIYIPYDNRIIRKRLYRTDQYGVFRLLDVIDRLADSYIDIVPEEMLGAMIEPDYFRPPRAANMRAVDNRMAYIDCIDRRGTRRSSRIHLSRPFIPHQVDDGECFDVQPEDGQRVVWCEAYYGHLIVWKERSIYTIDMTNFDKAPRDLSIGCIAPLSVTAIPGVGFGWLSHEGIMFGDHSNLDRDTGEQIWDDLKDFTPQQLSRAVAWYKDRYYYIFFGYDVDATGLYSTTVGGDAGGYFNGIGYACYLPDKTWTRIDDWNVQSVSVWRGGTDSSEVYTGSRFGFVNKMFDGEVDLVDNVASTEQQITSHIRAIDYDFTKPYTDKYLNWLIFHAKNLSADPTRKALLTFTPYYDQVATDPMDDKRIEHSTYKKYDLCHDPGDFGTLLGFTVDGVKRYALKEITMNITDLGHRPSQSSGTY